MRVLLLLLSIAGCDHPPLPLPTEAAVEDVEEADGEPALPLAQVLYGADSAGPPSAELQRVRLLLWLQHMELSPDQLALLDDLRTQAAERVARLEETEATRAAEARAARQATLVALWEALSAGVALDSPRVAELSAELQALDATLDPGGAHLTRRMEALRSLLDAEQALLRTLTPNQEARLNDALFVLRHRLDPVGRPGDFRALVGSIYDPGQFAVLTRGASAEDLAIDDIGGLWGESRAGLQGHPLHDAQREVILLMAALEPGLDEAIAAARALPAAPDAPPEPVAPDRPPPGDPAPPVEGQPAEPAPGAPSEPVPGAPSEPAPGEPSPAEPEAPPPG